MDEGRTHNLDSDREENSESNRFDDSGEKLNDLGEKLKDVGQKLNDVGQKCGKPYVEKCSGEEQGQRETDKSCKVTPDVMASLTAKMKSMTLPDKILVELNLDGIATYIKEKPCRNIVTMVGAGISTAAGIPDFRSPGTGLYHNLKKYKLPYTQAIFELKYFMSNPEPFYQLASELLPGDYQPTKSHYFIRLLQEKGILLRHYTQNIDNLDRLAGISEEKLVEAHGTFHKSHCVECKFEYDFEWLKGMMTKNEIPHCSECNNLVKPDIIFFGENLPKKFFQHIASDFTNCDLLIIMGSSLEVEPFASLATRPRKTCPRLMINATKVGRNIDFQFGKKGNQKDVLWIGDSDDGCQELADKLGWGEELLELTKAGDKYK